MGSNHQPDVYGLGSEISSLDDRRAGDCYANVAEQLCSQSGVAELKQQLERAGQTDAWAAKWQCAAPADNTKHCQHRIHVQQIRSGCFCWIFLAGPALLRIYSFIQSCLIRCRMKKTIFGSFRVPSGRESCGAYPSSSISLTQDASYWVCVSWNQSPNFTDWRFPKIGVPANHPFWSTSIPGTTIFHLQEC